MARPRTAYAVLAALSALICGFSLLRGLDPFDEGLMLQAARRITEGQLPYRDFLYPYGPAHPYLLAGLHELFAPSLVIWRIVRLVVDVAVAVGVFALVRRRAPTWLALLAWLVAVTAIAQPLSANPFPPALLLALLAVSLAGHDAPGWRWPAAAGVAAGLAAAWRLDFGVYAAAAAFTALLLRPGAGRRRRAAACAGGLAVVLAIAYGPFLVAAGPADSWDALVAKSLREREWWTLPFPLDYDGGLALWPPGDLLRDAKDVLDFYAPLALLVGAAVAAAVGLLRWRREGALPWRWAGWTVLALGFVAYLRSRTDPFHETPLRVTLAVLLAYCAGWALTLRTRGARIAATGAALSVLALLAIAGTAGRLSALFDPPQLVSLDLPQADGVKVTPAEARTLPQAVRLVQHLVPPGEPIHVVTRRSDLVRVGNPLFPFLAERPTVLDRDFDLWTSDAAQRRIVAALEKTRPRAVLRWNDPRTSRAEPNRRGRPSGSRALDEYLARAYRRSAVFGWYEVLVPADESKR